MIRTFLGLKRRLLRNVLRRQEGLGLVVFTFVTLALGGSTAAWMWREDLELVSTAAPLMATVVLAAWVFAPLLFGASDETLDPTRLALFPLEARPLAAGVAAAGLLGPGPLAAALPATALALRSPSLPSLAIGLLAVATFLTGAVVLSRWLLSALGARMRRRRGRDLATLLGGLAAGAFGLGLQALLVVGDDVSRADLDRAAGAISWLPIAWSGDAIGRAANGELLIPLLQVTGSVALILVAFHRWAASLARSLTEVDEGTTETGSGRPLLGRVSRLDRVSPRVAAILAKERRYLVRHPRYRVQVVSQGTVLLIGGAPFLSAVIARDPQSVLLGCIPGLTAGVTGSNLLGSDGRGLWAEALALPTMRPLLRGRSLAFLGLGIGLSLVLTFAVAAFTSGWRYIPPALGASVGMALAGAGIGAFASTLAPAPFPDDTNPNPFAGSSPGGGCLNGLATFGGVMAGLVTAGPILFGLAAARDSWMAGAAVTAFAPLYGLAIWLVVTHWAGRRVDARLPELLLTMSAA